MTNSERRLARIQVCLEYGAKWVQDWIMENSDPQNDDALIAWNDMWELRDALELLWDKHKDYLLQITNKFEE